MKKFIIKITSYFLLASALWTLTSWVIDANLKKVEYDYFAINQYYQGNIDVNLLIVGNSRARGDVSPMIIDSILHVNSFNIGMDAANYPIQEALYNIFVTHNKKPDYIIMLVDELSLNTGYGQIARKEAFLPHLNDTIVENLLRQHGALTLLESFLPFRYIYSPQSFFYGLLEFLGFHQGSNRNKGYEGTDAVWDGNFDRLKEKKPQGEYISYDPELFVYFEDYIQRLLRTNVQIAFVAPPHYIEAQEYTKNREEAISFYQKMAQKYDIPFLDFSNDSISYSKYFFHDSLHMNKRGSELFSSKLADKLKNYFTINENY